MTDAAAAPAGPAGDAPRDAVPTGAVLATSLECQDCGKLLRIRRVPPGVDSRCPRCCAVVRRHRGNPLVEPLALILSCLLLGMVTVSMPFLSVHLLGRERDSHIGSGAWAFLDDGLWLMAAVVLVTVLLVPLLRMALRLAVLLGLTLPRPPRRLGQLLRWHEHMNAWSMLEVFLFGALVSYSRLVDLADVQLGPAVYGLGALVLALAAADAAFEPQAAWETLERRGLMARRPQASPAAAPAGTVPIACHCCRRVALAREGEPCARCGCRLHRRKPDSLARTWALLAAAAILYIPANAYPVMTIVTLGHASAHTIMGGVMEFIAGGYWPLALIVFLASVAIPLLKLVGLAVMLASVHNRAAGRLVARTRLYRAVEVLGRWSMIDVFVVSVLIAVMRFGNFATIIADVGVACFGAVVILTMLAAEMFDPRLMWDAAGAQDSRAA